MEGKARRAASDDDGKAITMMCDIFLRSSVSLRKSTHSFFCMQKDLNGKTMGLEDRQGGTSSQFAIATTVQLQFPRQSQKKLRGISIQTSKGSSAAILGAPQSRAQPEAGIRDYLVACGVLQETVL
jgi:hypothetical protein